MANEVHVELPCKLLAGGAEEAKESKDEAMGEEPEEKEEPKEEEKVPKLYA